MVEVCIYVCVQCLICLWDWSCWLRLAFRDWLIFVSVVYLFIYFFYKHAIS